MEGLNEQIERKLEKLAESFQTVLYEEDKTFLENMKKNNLAGDDLRRYQFWEWTQGVGLYGFWKLFLCTGRQDYLDVLLQYYDRQMGIGFPAKNVNTVAPLLAMCLVGEYAGRQDYLAVCGEWAEWIMKDFPRTREGGFQHCTSDSVNEQELWDDTLYMTVLFLAKYGTMTGRREYVEEAEYQFLLHMKYLTDKKTGLWFHGWSFLLESNFTEALWGRGNCWITMAIPEFLELAEPSGAVRRCLTESYRRQAEALRKYQDEGGMWHTLVDDASSYVESSATCGFAYGILKGVHMGLLDASYAACAERAIVPILANINEDGVVEQVSYGTPMGRESKDFYKQIPIRPMPYGQALAILFLLEMTGHR